MEHDHSVVTFLTVDAAFAGQRLDNFLLARLKGLPRSRLYRLLRRGEVRVNKGRVRPSYRVNGGDVVRVPPLRLSAPAQVATVPDKLVAQLEAAIIYEDERFLAINKPCGLAVHGGSGVRLGLIEALRQIRTDEASLELVHRLDRDTSGCLLVAKKRSALKQAHEALRLKQAEKHYLAMVAGRWPPGLNRVNAPLKKNVLQSGERMVTVAADGKRSCTRFDVRRRIGTFSLLDAWPETGRTHQIRVHAQSAGFPLCGDVKYGNDATNAELKQAGFRELFLHAAGLAMDIDGKALRIECEPPGFWQRFEEQFSSE